MLHIYSLMCKNKPTYDWFCPKNGIIPQCAGWLSCSHLTPAMNWVFYPVDKANWERIAWSGSRDISSFLRHGKQSTSPAITALNAWRAIAMVIPPLGMPHSGCILYIYIYIPRQFMTQKSADQCPMSLFWDWKWIRINPMSNIYIYTHSSIINT